MTYILPNTRCKIKIQTHFRPLPDPSNGSIHCLVNFTWCNVLQLATHLPPPRHPNYKKESLNTIYKNKRVSSCSDFSFFLSCLRVCICQCQMTKSFINNFILLRVLFLIARDCITKFVVIDESRKPNAVWNNIDMHSKHCICKISSNLFVQAIA